MILVGDCIAMMKTLPAQSVHCCVTSPPYWGLRDYGVDGQIGLEATPEAFVAHMVEVFREVRRVLRDDGTLWVNMGDSYCAHKNGNTLETIQKSTLTTRADGTRKIDNASTGRLGGNAKSGQEHGDVANAPNRGRIEGIKSKDLVGMPWMLAFALRADGWYLRSEIIWHKPNPMPESVTDRPTKSHEQLFLLTKNQRYYFDQEAVRVPSSPNTNMKISQAAAADVAAARANGAMTTEAGSINRKKRHEFDGMVKQNTSFENATCMKVADRNIRSVWTISTQAFSEAHFATFPEKLVEPCILSGTSEKGCCPECGAPWKRTVDKQRIQTRPGASTKIKVPNGWDTGAGAHGSFHRNGRGETEYRDTLEVGNRDPGRHVSQTTTTGWQPGCEHGLEPIPCTVLDCFGGAGTTGLVAAKLGRNYILTELNPEYAAMAEARIRNRNATGPVIEPLPGQMELFL